MNRLISLWIVILGAFGVLWAGNPVYAGEVRVEEVTISLYNKPVTGFRIVLDRSQSYVTKQVLEHVLEHTSAKPFQYERTIIYENIRYAPITEDRDISLYFLLRDLQGQFTELTYVAMYDYKRSVNSREFPDLAMRLQADLAQLVRATTGDVLQGKDIVFDDETLHKLAQGNPATSGTASDPDIEHFREEEVENDGVLIRRDPFAQPGEPGTTVAKVKPTSNDTTVARLRERVRQLETREQELLSTTQSLRADQDLLSRKQELMTGKVKLNKTFRDSIKLLNQRIEGLLGQYYVADDVSISSETSEQVFELEKAKSQNQRRIDRLVTENDSLRDLSGRMFTQFSALSQTRKEQVETLTKLQDENKTLTSEVEDLQQRNELLGIASGSNATDSLMTQLRTSFARNADQQGELERQQNEVARLTDDNSWLTGKKLQLEERIQTLEKDNRTLDEMRRANVPGVVRIDDATPPPATADNSALRDSLQQLRQRLNYLESQASESSDLVMQLKKKEDEVLTLNQRVRTLEKVKADQLQKLGAADNEKARLSAKAKIAEDRAVQRGSELKIARAERDKAMEAEASLQGQLQRTKDMLGESGGASQALLDSISYLQSRSRGLENEVRNRERQVRKQVAARDSLQGLVQIGNNQRNELSRQVNRLESRIDSLRRSDAPVSDQQQFLREQRSRQEQVARDFEARENALVNREKLAKQRQSFIDQKEQSLASREAKIKGLEAREADLLLREQQLNARTGITGTDVRVQDIRESRVVEFGHSVPVFFVESNLSYKAARKQVVGFFLNRDAILDEQFPDILYRSIVVPELGERPVEFKVRIDSKGTGTVLQISIRLENEQYLGTEASRKANDKAKQLISSLLRYKNQG